MNYTELLKDPRWQKKRLEILQRDDFTCKMCQDKETTLHVHHQYYKIDLMPWEYKDDCYVTLCEHCHTGINWIKQTYRTDHVSNLSFKKRIERVNESTPTVTVAFRLNSIVHMDKNVIGVILEFNSENRVISSFGFNALHIEQMKNCLQPTEFDEPINF